ncbi:MAG: carotenoid oxygenase family protein [Pseudomonadota bacterium]
MTFPLTSNRRQLLAGIGAAGFAGALAPRACSQVVSAGEMPGWQAGYRTAPAAGYPAAPMRRISGRLPNGFAGDLFRNGPAHFDYSGVHTGHWFDGDGMVQRIRFSDGQAVHTGRFVDTPKRRAELAAQRFLAPGFGTAGSGDFSVMGPDDVNAANTAVIRHDGRLYALWEAGSAFELDPETLETVGPKAWREDLKSMPFLAHSKREPDGTLRNLAIGGATVGIYQIAANGLVRRFDLVDIGANAYIHDWAMTDRHLVILVQPWLRTTLGFPVVDHMEWQPEHGLRILIVDKDDTSQIRWAEAPPRFFYHTGAAWEDRAGAIHVDLGLYAKPVLSSGAATGLMRGMAVSEGDTPQSAICRLIIPRSGPVTIEDTGIEGEFPTVHPDFHGLGRRYTAWVGGHLPGRPGAHRVAVTDWKSGRADHFDYGPKRIAEEHVVVAKPGGRDEADAWIVGTVLNIAKQCQEAHVFDLAGLSDGPVASFAADYAWPLGFHGTFAAA